MSVTDRDIDPLFRDLTEKKHNFRRNVVSLATELKEVRSRLADQEQSFVHESLTRQEAEAKTKKMEEEMRKLHRSLEERNWQLQASASATEMYLRDLEDLKSQLSTTKATADASAATAQSAQIQCMALIKELDQKNCSIEEHEIRVNKLAEQLDLLQKDLHEREFSQKHLKDEVIRIEHDIMQALAKAGNNNNNKDSELMKILDEVSPNNFSKINNLISAKDVEISKLRDEIRSMSSHWKLKTKDLESQLEKHRRADQELKKKVLKLEFCLHDARAQTRKLQRMGERRDKALKELKDELAALKQQAEPVHVEKQNIWEAPGFKLVVSVSMLILVIVTKR